MKKIVLVADDYTGAADAGVYLLATGQAVTLILPGAEPARSLGGVSGAIAFNSETRFLPPDRAESAVRAIFAHCRQAGFEFFFKKVDSTLRGNPGAETAAALDATGLGAALVCATFPAMGRTCLDGAMFVHGKPLIETEIARDRFTPLSSSRPDEILAAQTGLRAGHLPLALVRGGADAARREIARLLAAGARLIVADAATDADLDALAELLVAEPSLLPVGSGGLSRAYSEALAGKPSGGLPPYRMKGPLLAVMGSLTSNADAQTEHALAEGSFGLVTLDIDRCRADREAEIGRVAAAAKKLCGRHIILNARPKGSGTGTSLGLEVGRMVGLAVGRILAECGCLAMFSTGGATSAALCAELGLDRIVLEREVFPGTVAGYYHNQDGEKRWFVSKAGGFGGKEVLTDLLRFIE